MTLFSLITGHDRRPVAFMEHFRTHWDMWTLAAMGGSGRPIVATFSPCQHGRAAGWIAKAQKQGRNVCALMAELTAPVSDGVIVRGHLRGTRHLGVKIPAAASKVLDDFTPAPFIRLETGRGGNVYAVWRLLADVTPEAAELVAKGVAARLGGVSLGNFVPVGGTKYDGAMVELVYMHKDRVNLLTDF